MEIVGWAVIAVMLLVSIRFSDRRRVAVTLLVSALSLVVLYLLSAVNGFELTYAAPVSVCFGVGFASLETKLFPWFALVSALMSGAFLASGVAIWGISAGFMAALLSRYVVEWGIRNIEKGVPGGFFYPAYGKSEKGRSEERTEAFEYRRKAFHFIGGLLIIWTVHSLGEETSLLLFGISTLLSLSVINSLSGGTHGALGQILEMMERHGKRPMDGVLWFLAGTMVLLLFSETVEFVYVGIFVMAAGDAAAAIMGKRFGSVKWFHNRKKSIVGSLAFVLFSLPALLFHASPVVLFGVVLCSAIESFDWGMDDNMFAAFVFMVISHF
ncbi:MAG: hypothetical protein ABIG39_04460 [Candidatus Micrarchaeota archaeon]